MSKIQKETIVMVNTTGTFRNFKVLKTIKLGIGPQCASDFQKALEAAGCHVSDWGSSILLDPAFSVSLEEIECEIVSVSNEDLGFDAGAKVRDTYARAIECGLELCPIEVGPRMCLEGEECFLGMEPVIDSACNGNIFYVERNASGSIRLRGEYCNMDDFFVADKCFVFIRRK